jgi:hypothetical protein
MTAPTLPGQPHIHYRNGQLQVEDCVLNALAAEFGTPLFVYSKASMLAALAAYQRGFAGRNAQICYAMKANSTLGVLQVFAQAGCGFDIVSGGELARVMAAGANAAKVIFSGVGKTRRWKLALAVSTWRAKPRSMCSMPSQSPWANKRLSAFASTQTSIPKPTPIFRPVSKATSLASRMNAR